MSVRGLLLRCVAVAIGLTLGLLSAELGLRIAAPQEKSWLDIYRNDPVLPFYSLAPGISTVIETGEGRWQVRTDARGHRVGTSDASEPDGPALLVIGDSFAFGHGVDQEASFAARVAEELAGGARLVNTGVPGYGPVQYRKVLEAELAAGERPALVLLSLYLGNDFLDCVWEKNVHVVDGAMVSDTSRWRNWIKRNLHVYRLTSKVYQRLAYWSRPGRDPEEDLFFAEAWSQGELARAYTIFSSELDAIAELCRKVGVPILALVIPKETTLAPPETAGENPADFGLPVAKAAQALQAARIPFIDLTGPLRALGAENAYFARDGHLTVRGNEIAAAEISRALQGVLPSHDD